MGSTVLETNTAGNPTADQKYRAYGKQRDAGAVVTDHKFTGQKLDGTGLQYYNARYYDPAMGVFISPDTIVPDATNVFDYNRYMMVRGNPLKYNDPSGHTCVDIISGEPGGDCGGGAGSAPGGVGGSAGGGGGSYGRMSLPSSGGGGGNWFTRGFTKAWNWITGRGQQGDPEQQIPNVQPSNALVEAVRDEAAEAQQITPKKRNLVQQGRLKSMDKFLQARVRNVGSQLNFIQRFSKHLIR